jgi:uncharacterized membrane protein
VRARLQQLREQVRSGFWAVPAGAVLASILLALGLVEVDRHVGTSGLRFTFGAGPDGAREVLSAITTAMITFTGLVFSITVVVLQLTSSQFSPRVLRTFLRDRQTQWALGVFTATFVYAVLVLRTVRSGGGADDFVPELATTAAVLLLLASVALFVTYIHHISTAIQASSIIAAIGRETVHAIDRRYPTDAPEPPEPMVLPSGVASAVLVAPRSGVLVSVDEQRLVALASAASVVLRTELRLGDYVPEGAPLIEVLGDPGDLHEKAVLQALVQARDRRLEEDVAFGFRQLVDIGERALSPGINDPTTAVQALDELHDLLRRLATRRLAGGSREDEKGQTRLLLPPEHLADYLHLALDEIWQYGADAVQVRTRVGRLLADLAAAARPEHRAAVEELRRACS